MKNKPWHVILEEKEKARKEAADKELRKDMKKLYKEHFPEGIVSMWEFLDALQYHFPKHVETRREFGEGFIKEVYYELQVQEEWKHAPKPKTIIVGGADVLRAQGLLKD